MVSTNTSRSFRHSSNNRNSTNFLNGNNDGSRSIQTEKVVSQTYVKIQMALFVATGFIVGAFLGAHFVQGLPDVYLKRAFGIFLIIMGIRMALIK